MNLSWSCLPGSPDVPMEDYVATAPGVAVALDGVTRVAGTDTGCRHGTPWYVAALGTRLLAEAAAGAALTDALAGALGAVAAAHRSTCDLSKPATPAATVAALQWSPECVRWLVLGDATVVLGGGSAAPEAFTDARNAAVARADPAVAYRGLTGERPGPLAGPVALLTDGASRLVDLFSMLDWRALLALLDDAGPAGLLARTRQVECGDAGKHRWPRYKVHDDAAVVYIRPTQAR